MKLKIKCIQNPLWVCSVWRVEFNSITTDFNSNLAAITFADKQWKRYYKEQAAYSMLISLSINLLSIAEAMLHAKLLSTKCKGITKKQYGYLKGIHERQEREW